MEIRELEQLVDLLYVQVDIKYKTNFSSIIGGCHCIPPTEWYGDIFLVFSKLLRENAIHDSQLKEKVCTVVELLSQYFT